MVQRIKDKSLQCRARRGGFKGDVRQIPFFVLCLAHMGVLD